jgi:hypothetical protein
MTTTKEPDRADLAFTTGPAAIDQLTGDTCQRCGRDELVKVTMPAEDDARATQTIVDTAGDEVKPGAKATVCALCGAIQTSRTLKDGGRTAARATSKASSRKAKGAGKRKSTRRSTSTSRRSSKTAAQRRRTTARGR